ncbi:MAG: DUF2974 domain-containing protein [Anaerotruncus sp.]|nr:DUF2974 domain-containing protein [Anaerotruncus sp.]
MSSLSNLSDKQNHLLTQLSYQSHILQDKYNGQSLNDIYKKLSSIYGKNNAEVKKFKRYIDGGLGDIVIKDVGNDKVTGFGAIAFEDSNGNIGISYRGTDGISKESINDWIGNVSALATGTSMQTAQAEAFYQKNRGKNDNNYLYGHSKGGNLAQSVFVNHYDEINKMHNLNPQPINPYGLTPDQKIALNSDKVDIVVTEGDYVWFLGAIGYSLDKIRVMDNSAGSNAHTYDGRRYDKNGNIVPGKQPILEYASYGVISLLLNGIQKAGATIQHIYNIAVRVIDFVENDVIPMAMSLINKVVNGIRDLGQKFAKFADSIEQFFNDIVKNISTWIFEHSKGYKYASANPNISINTTTMVNYASQLRSLSKRSKKLDSNMNSLYWHLGIEWDTIANLGKLLKSGIVLDFAFRLDKCANYLADTANEFDSVERELQKI